MSANLHGQIMNIQCQNPPPISLSSGFTAQREAQAYKEGHRDARHAAAELAIKADSQAEEMLEALRTAALALAWASVRHKEVAAAYKRVNTAIEVVTRSPA